EVAAFRDRFGGRCVLKPTNRQASLGVQLLGPDDDLAAAWEATRLVDEPRMLARGAMPMGFLVEERLDGPEVSVECLVDRGRPVFSNITAKLVQPGPRPVELGHTVPAPLPDAVSRRLASAMADLITVTGFGSGVLHAEWILRNGTQPHLVECAARLPGDCIDTLIDLAYGGSILADLLAVLGGGQPATPPAARGGAAIRFLTARPGVVSAVTGVDEARALPGVREVTVSTALGATVPATNSSWDRIGSVIATARTAAEAGELAARAAETIAVETEPPA
ncbi:MAG: ATP-grasp domain-containing protein, partial [Micromonosporaceae bacterium]|nr:ATP-grasp domain-containing protein [Micromonosporaceae bacterium]